MTRPSGSVFVVSSSGSAMLETRKDMLLLRRMVEDGPRRADIQIARKNLSAGNRTYEAVHFAVRSLALSLDADVVELDLRLTKTSHPLFDVHSGWTDPIAKLAAESLHHRAIESHAQ